MENQKTTEEKPFKALSRICLNNWHYIDKKVLSFRDGINFFTGHSGSGKSTVIDALQVVLYANTDGRAFFNKAAADDSDRSLIEYLRGMVSIGENDADFPICGTGTFPVTIVLELDPERTPKEQECIGIVFDVETASNDIGRLFFRHSGRHDPGRSVPERESGAMAGGRGAGVDADAFFCERIISARDITSASAGSSYDDLPGRSGYGEIPACCSSGPFPSA